jgi:phosphoglucosamine mutase
MGLFGTAGIRGNLNKITPELALNLGRALAKFLDGSGSIGIGRDGRTSSEMLMHAFISGLISGGLHCEIIGVIPTPVLAFASTRRNYKAGVMLTASHNPPSDGGLKFFESGIEYSKEYELKLEEILENRKFIKINWTNLGGILSNGDIIREYMDKIITEINELPRKKVVIDCANGVGALVTPFIFRELGCEVITINSQIDGFFPAGKPEPTPENLQTLIQVVKSVKADIGLAHDGDADRIAIVDEKGNIIQDDKIIAWLSGAILDENPGRSIITSINTSYSIQEVVEEKGGYLVRVPLGALHEGLKKHNGIFAGEPWKLIYPDFGMWIDGIFSAVKILKLCGNRKISEIFDEVPNYYLLRKSFFLDDTKKTKFMEYIGQNIEKTFNGITKILTIDGFRVEFEDNSWILIRSSGTEPKGRIVCEAKTKHRAKQLFTKLKNLVNGAKGK